MTDVLPVDLDPMVIEQLGRELDAIYDATIADLGERDERYIRRLIRSQRTLAVGSRIVMVAGAWLGPRGLLGRRRGTNGRRVGSAMVALGTAGLGLAKVLENMEIGHNVMHGQWDWMNDPEINSTVWEWDTVCAADHWKHGHNIVHHTWTNVLGMDRDIGYEIMRTTSRQPWNPVYLAQPLYNALLTLLFEWGVGLHEVDFDKLFGGTIEERATQFELLRGFARKAARQTAKDYILWPSLGGTAALDVVVGDAIANLIRNVWAYTIIFCGHFPDGVHLFSKEVIEDETRAGWYLRQLLGAANITGGPAFHVLAGNLSHQIEHHLFPDMPSNRYPEVAPRIRALCAKYGLPYNSGPLRRQIGTTTRKIWRYALPGGQDRVSESPSVHEPPAGAVRAA